MTQEGRSEGARDLIVATFRLAVADYLGHSYSHDADAPTRMTSYRSRSEARTFLNGAWAAYLADLVGIEASAVWREARLLDDSATAGLPRNEVA